MQILLQSVISNCLGCLQSKSKLLMTLLITFSPTASLPMPRMKGTKEVCISVFVCVYIV